MDSVLLCLVVVCHQVELPSALCVSLFAQTVAICPRLSSSVCDQLLGAKLISLVLFDENLSRYCCIAILHIICKC